MKTRPILVLVITLIIGFVLGMLTSAQLRYYRLRPMRMYFSDDRFREGFYRIIQPDERQKLKIDLILDRYSKLNSQVQEDFRKELNTNVEAMRKELDQNLTKDQITRLKEMDKRRQQMMREAIRKHHQDTVRYRHSLRPGENGRRSPGGFGRSEGPPPPFSEPDTSRLPD